MKIETTVADCGKCGARFYLPVSFVAPGRPRFKTLPIITILGGHILREHQDIDPAVYEFLRKGGKCPKCGVQVPMSIAQTTAHAQQCGLLPFEIKVHTVELEHKLEGNHEVIIDPEKGKVVAEMHWPPDAFPEEIRGGIKERKTSEVREEKKEKPKMKEKEKEETPEPMPTSESVVPEPVAASPAVQPEPPSPPAPSKPEAPQQLPQLEANVPEEEGEIEEEEGEIEEEEREEDEGNMEREEIKWRPVTEIIREHGEHYHLKPRPRRKPRREEYEEEEYFEEERRPRKKRSYVPLLIGGVLAVALVGYLLYRRKRSGMQPSSGASLGVPTSITPVTPPPTPPSNPQPEEKTTSKPAPIPADWTSKLKVI